MTGPWALPAGASVSDALRQAGASLAMPCAGRGTCGKCAVWLRGPAVAPSNDEAAHLARLSPGEPPAAGFVLRLACRARTQGPCEAYVPDTAGARIETGTADALPAYDGGEGGLGVAIDIGTTTVAARLYRLDDGLPLATEAALNRQAAYGADVLSRIAYANEHGQAEIGGALRAQLADLCAAVLAQAGHSADAVTRAVLCGNTTMLHFAAGLDPRGIGVSPFTPEDRFGYEIDAAGLLPLPRAALYLPRCQSAYVGADITCALVAAGFDAPGPVRMLVDIGTNGEMALAVDGRLLVCATAAGPAFEGAEISVGMPAAEGAICRVWAEGGALAYETIGGGPARGLCGTGLVGAVRALLETGALDETGYLDGGVAQIGDSGISLTAQDIRALQLAKAAIAAGIDALPHAAGVPTASIAELALAGGFGSTLDVGDAVAIGLIPVALAPRTRARGNLALAGAAQMLLSRARRQAGEMMADAATEAPLATDPYFMDQYMEHMLFPEG